MGNTITCKKYNVYIEEIGEPELLASVDTLDEAWDKVIQDMDAAIPDMEYVAELNFVRKPACVVQYQQQKIIHPPYVIYDIPKVPSRGFTDEDIIWIGNLHMGCYYVTTRTL